MIQINGKRFKELKNDNDSITLRKHKIRWSKRQQRYTIKKGNKQIYDTEYYESAIRWVLRNT